jgi:hypothetical protein
MRDDVVLDAVVYLAGDHTSIDEVVFAAIGPVTDDARCPGAGHAGNLKQFIEAGGVDVSARFGWGRILRAGLGSRGLKGKTRIAGYESADQRSRQESEKKLYPHQPIFFLGRWGRKPSDRNMAKRRDWEAGFLQK